VRFTLSIDCDNAAFDEIHGDEVARILRDTARRLEGSPLRDGESGALRDINGNEVGQWLAEEVTES